jgi:hypothetical protein
VKTGAFFMSQQGQERSARSLTGRIENLPGTDVLTKYTQ